MVAEVKLGVTNGEPEPTGPVAFAFEYQEYKVPPPPEAVSVAVFPQVMLTLEVVGAAGEPLTFKVYEAQVLLNKPLLKFLAKYVVLAPGVTVIEFPVPIKVVPHPPVYQYTVPTAPWAVRVAEDPTLQMEITDDVIAVGAVGFIDAQIAVPVEPPLIAEPVCKVCIGITVVPTLLVTRI